MIQSITFGDKNTWDDWKIVPKERPVFAPPKVKTTYIDIPGGNGSIDLSESLTGYPVYENRTGSFKFYVMNGYADWQDRYSEIMNYLHGQRMKAVLADDPDYYYYGRFTVDSWDSGDTWSEITIGYEVEPYKWALTSWSRTYNVNYTVWYGGGYSMSDNKAPVYPTITVSESIYFRFENESRGIEETTVLLQEGTTELPDFLIYGNERFSMATKGISGDTFTAVVTIPQGRL